MKKCSTAGCNNKHLAKDLCGLHYKRARVGSKIIGPSIRQPLEVRFWHKVDKIPGKGPKGDCWEWTGSLNNDGYGKIVVKEKIKLAHRISWEISFGEIPKEICVLHKCDNPSCVNHNHLLLGTQADNIVDRDKKGRCKKGENRKCLVKIHLI